MSKTYTAVFDDPAKANAALNDLTAAGFLADEISVLMSADTHAAHFDLKNKSKALQGVATGGVAGGTLGAIVGALTAVAGIALTGGVGLLAAGPAVAALTVGGAGAAAGGAIGGLIGLGIPEHEVKLIEERLGKGDVLLAVTCSEPDRAERAKQILEHSGAETVSRA